ncbi:restriction endonuclease subunit S [Burkholderia ubonensis]|uniref:restriction endonuclease subunit S n=1 Tax=Burkholderia ubonensis TaxID=101571 RepID=UPI000AC899D1|nr:restriction endonuclease subunit S [Burkholderia ubonensis]
MTTAKRLDSVCEITMGQAPSGDTYNNSGEGLPLIAGAGDFGDLYPKPKKYTTDAWKKCSPGDIVLGIRATIGEKVWSDAEYCLGRGVAGLRPKNGLDSAFLWHWLSHNAPSLAAKGKGATFKQVNREDIGSLGVFLPPIEEQRRIAAILDKADELRAKRKEALALLDSMAQSIFVDMFGNPVESNNRWPTASLSKLGKVMTGGTPPSSKDGMFGGDIPFITPGDLESDAPVKRTLTRDGANEVIVVRSGAAMVCCIGATIGKMGKADGNCAFNQQINVVDWDPLLVDDNFGLIALTFLKPLIKAWGASTTLPILKKSSFQELKIPVPPIRVQREFGEKYMMHIMLRRQQKIHIDRLEELFISLQHRAFAGEL